MKYRPQRGGLDEAMRDLVELEPTIEALALHLTVEPSRITVYKYAYDHRIGWNTHVVCIDGQAIGFTDGPAIPYQSNNSNEIKP